jgi:hypothetical protein
MAWGEPTPPLWYFSGEAETEGGAGIIQNTHPAHTQPQQALCSDNSHDPTKKKKKMWVMDRWQDGAVREEEEKEEEQQEEQKEEIQEEQEQEAQEQKEQKEQKQEEQEEEQEQD